MPKYTGNGDKCVHRTHNRDLPYFFFDNICLFKHVSSVLKAAFVILDTDTVVHLFQNGSETLSAGQANKLKLVR